MARKKDWNVYYKSPMKYSSNSQRNLQQMRNEPNETNTLRNFTQ